MTQMQPLPTAAPVPRPTAPGDDLGSDTAAPAAMLRIEAWFDPVIDEVGHDPRSSYAETYWLPILGPSTTWLLRHLSSRLDASPEGIDLDVEETARSLGLGERMGPNAPFARTLKRCVDFDMAQWRGHWHFAVRRRLPPLARRHLRRLPDSLQARHEEELAAGGKLPAVERLRRHGRQLALSLLDLGEDPSGAEQQLCRWSFHPSLASECAAWAMVEHARRATGSVPGDAGENESRGGAGDAASGCDAGVARPPSGGSSIR